MEKLLRHILNSDLTFSSTFGKRGSGVGQFTRPVGIACDSTGKVYSSLHRRGEVLDEIGGGGGGGHGGGRGDLLVL